MSLRPSLRELLDGLLAVPSAMAGLRPTGLQLDSRRVVPGDVFVAVAGARAHGLQHLEEVRRRGAVAVLVDPAGAPHVEGDDLLVVPGLRSALGRIATRFHGTSVELPVVGVTGTNGKTSTVQLLAQALSAHPLLGPCGHIGTLGAGVGDWREDGERTTPDVLSVHALLASLRQRGARCVAMEVSSHALEQGRVDAVPIRVAAFSNLTRDHLDYHGSMEAYGAAKARLFALPGVAAAVLNIDDTFGAQIAACLPVEQDVWRVSARGAAGARLRAESAHADGSGLHFQLVEGATRAPIDSPLLGGFNIDNLLLVAGCLRALGLGFAEVATRLAQLQPVRGRMNRLPAAPGQPLVVVDYAHTPDALDQALQALRAHTSGRLVCVFGCGGDRDRGKRPLMAAIAERGADRVLVTDDNPRSEDGDVIVAEILAGLQRPQAVQVERDRARAIALALAGATPGDTVLIAGKGHETYQEVGSERRPFDDLAVARDWLEARAA